MKTTIDLPTELLKSATQQVAAEGIALPDLIARLLRRHLKKSPKRRPGPLEEEREHLDWRQELL